MRIATGIAIGIAVVALLIAAFAVLKLGEVTHTLEAAGQRKEGQAEAFVAQVKALAGDVDAVKGDVKTIAERMAALTQKPSEKKSIALHVIPLLEHRDPAVRRSTATILKGLRAQEAIEALTATAQTDPDNTVRREAYEALTDIGGEGLLGFLIASLDSNDAQTVQLASEQMGKVAHESFFEPLATIFEEKIKEVAPYSRGRGGRVPAGLGSIVSALMKVDHDKGLPLLLHAMEEAWSDNIIQQTVNESLRRDDVPKLLEWAQGLPPLDKDDNNYYHSPHYKLIHLFQNTLRDPRAAPYLISIMTSGHQYLGREAANALRYVAGKDAFQPIADALKKAYTADKTPLDQQPQRLTGLIDALRNLNDMRACAVFVDILADTKNLHLKRYAAQALYSRADPAQGERVYKLWKAEKDKQTKDTLQRALQNQRDYGYVWDAAAMDFTKRGGG